MEIISRPDAAVQGLPRFFTGQPCRSGHTVERSTKTGVCIACTKVRNEARISADPEAHARRAREWQQANPERNRAQKLRWHRRRKYGVEATDVERLEREQKGVCPGCTKPLDHAGTPHLDHDHATGAVRGLLCGPCNLTLGYAFDDAATMRRLASYLDRSSP